MENIERITGAWEVTMIKKIPLKVWCIGGYYNYQINAGNDTWLEATPITPGTVTRTAENEKILRILLENDVMAVNKFMQKVR